jgi:hypothetical protein
MITMKEAQAAIPLFGLRPLAMILEHVPNGIIVQGTDLGKFKHADLKAGAGNMSIAGREPPSPIFVIGCDWDSDIGLSVVSVSLGETVSLFPFFEFEEEFVPAEAFGIATAETLALARFCPEDTFPGVGSPLPDWEQVVSVCLLAYLTGIAEWDKAKARMN